MVSGFGFRDLGCGIRDSGFGIRASGFGIRASGFGIRGVPATSAGSERCPKERHWMSVSLLTYLFRVQGSGCRVQGAGFRVQGSGFRVQGSGFRVQGGTAQISRQLKAAASRPPPACTWCLGFRV